MMITIGSGSVVFPIAGLETMASARPSLGAVVWVVIVPNHRRSRSAWS
jgi:hypothetical protein